MGVHYPKLRNKKVQVGKDQIKSMPSPFEVFYCFQRINPLQSFMDPTCMKNHFRPPVFQVICPSSMIR